ncbi:MAG: aminopeptidase P family N-terminal domain-containing protein, partial [Desulfovibrio sp.]|nr:aminopeptidase P family N-terminal domain-containing protein [Desulfovibrio sp.]
MDNIFLKRRDKVRNALIRRGFDALLVSSPANRFYLSGFELHDPQP